MKTIARISPLKLARVVLPPFLLFSAGSYFLFNGVFSALAREESARSIPAGIIAAIACSLVAIFYLISVIQVFYYGWRGVIIKNDALIYFNLIYRKLPIADISSVYVDRSLFISRIRVASGQNGSILSSVMYEDVNKISNLLEYELGRPKVF